MSEPIQVTGMILSVMPIGEYDKRVVLLTRERGKISMFARGVRKSNSTLMAATNPFVFGIFTVYEGRSSFTLVSADVRDYFMELANEQPGVYYGFYFLEFADYYGQEGIDETMMLNLLYVSLKALLSHRFSNHLVRRVFEIKILTINGDYTPEAQDMSPQARYACRYVVSAPIDKLYTFTLKPEVLTELEHLMDQYLHRVIDKKFKSLPILEMIDGS
ncbi:DNA repair protein RecO [Blautia liquoris]|uniref:DNA repair protein RecO n=1 Tax=Blautia liquoris TaxID=2779518 RepID=A0A7M2RIB7_9FIRM|nr:DNA repair protein RecO [Blautia liquoris]QOV19102.1 DNA repair protein RecO [Blautia liquoris]